MLQFEIPDLHSAITLYINDANSGAQPHRDDYHRAQLPGTFERLNVWTHLHFACPRLNEFYPNELCVLCCKSANTAGRLTFDPIFVELPSWNGASNKCKSHIPECYLLSASNHVPSAPCSQSATHLPIGIQSRWGGLNGICVRTLVLSNWET